MQKENRISSSMEGILQEKRLCLLLFSPVAFSTGKETQGIHTGLLLHVCVLFFLTMRSFPQPRAELSTCKYNGNLKWLGCSFSSLRVSRMNSGQSVVIFLYEQSRRIVKMSQNQLDALVHAHNPSSWRWRRGEFKDSLSYMEGLWSACATK